MSKATWRSRTAVSAIGVLTLAVTVSPTAAFAVDGAEDAHLTPESVAVLEAALEADPGPATGSLERADGTPESGLVAPEIPSGPAADASDPDAGPVGTDETLTGASGDADGSLGDASPDAEGTLVDEHDTASTVPPISAPAPAAASAPVTASDAMPASYPDPSYSPHWHDGGEHGFSCDYWYFTEPEEGGSGRDWAGWYGQPQLHILHHEIVHEDGSTQMVYDRDIADYWYHAWNGETASPDADGIHWSNTAGQQTVLGNGFKGGVDWDARVADARAFLERAGVTIAYPDSEWMTEENGYTPEEIAASHERYDEFIAYEATQFAVWYFSTGHDVMGLFFVVGEDGSVSLSDYALQQFDAETGSGWQYNGMSDRLATLHGAAWLIEQAINTTWIAPQPGFVSHGYVGNEDGSTDFGFTVTLVGGAGDVNVELRTTDGSALPAGVVLVDSAGRPVTSITPGQRVFVRVPAGTDVATLPALQIWGSAEGTEQGSPHFYKGRDNSGYDDEGNLTGNDHYLIGFGNLDQKTVAWDWAAIDLAALPPAPVDPVDPVEPPAPVAPVDPVTPVAPTGPTDPISADLADPASTVRVAASLETAAATELDGSLAETGTSAGILFATFLVLVGTGGALTLVSRRRRGAES
ncbi:hypothetical protein [Oerskovia enterophila]|uniref:Gram-positive cocci surface proteins LPxTG domain-containing protein n=1 Tax=Oerskovia enterophila TaxID=43678 RepID=A0A163QPE0_9CELL|nr:hypothetical protein [Oerskovia enterophila]KZM34386.1 hypothetical protein OJAG_29500 [Oerskovia enterophila]